MKFYKLQTKSCKLSAGFTLIEAFVAMTVLMIAILGPLLLFSRAIGDANSVKNQMIAYYLAQEGLELAINKLDSNRTQDGVMVPRTDSVWFGGLESCKTSAGCRIYYDFTPTAPGVAAPGESAPPSKLWIRRPTTPEGNVPETDNPTYTYTDTGNSQTIFSRTVSITAPDVGGIKSVGDSPIDPADPYYTELTIIATVKYREKGVDKAVSLRTVISN